MIWRWGLLLALGLSGAAQAQGIDHAAIFEREAARVVEAGTENGAVVETLQMENGIELRRLTAEDGVVTYEGIDRSGLGAVGCLYRIYFELDAAGRFCPWAPPPEAAQTFERRLNRIATFVAENGEPRREPGEAPAMLDTAREAYGREVARLGCPEPGEGMQGFAAALASEAMDPVLDMALSVPRLPVMLPCL